MKFKGLLEILGQVLMMAVLGATTLNPIIVPSVAFILVAIRAKTHKHNFLLNKMVDLETEIGMRPHYLIAICMFLCVGISSIIPYMIYSILPIETVRHGLVELYVGMNIVYTLSYCNLIHRALLEIKDKRKQLQVAYEVENNG